MEDMKYADVKESAIATNQKHVDDCCNAAEMPRYKCHKEVWALKIAGIKRDGEGEDRESDGSAIITPFGVPGTSYAPFHVSADYIHKHKPQVGGYYVVYADGYKSYSPAAAFEEGYSLVN